VVSDDVFGWKVQRGMRDYLVNGVGGTVLSLNDDIQYLSALRDLGIGVHSSAVLEEIWRLSGVDRLCRAHFECVSAGAHDDGGRRPRVDVLEHNFIAFAACLEVWYSRWGGDDGNSTSSA